MKVRRGVARERLWVEVEDGSILDAFAALAADHGVASGWVRGIGSLAWADLTVGKRLPGPLTVLSLEGALGPSGRLMVSLARVDGKVVGGELRDGDVLHLELWVEPFEAEQSEPSARWVAQAEDAVDETADDDDDGADDDDAGEGGLSWADVAAASAQQAEDTNAAVTWAQVAEASEAPAPPSRPPPSPPSPPRRRAQKRPARAALDVVPEKGDFIHHRQFGLCKVNGPSKGGGVVVRLPSGIRKTIRLDYLDVGQPRDEGGRRVFPVRPKKR